MIAAILITAGVVLLAGLGLVVLWFLMDVER